MGILEGEFMNTRERREWKRIRARGFGRYVLLNGTVGWGIGFSTASIVLDIFYPKLFSYQRPAPSNQILEWLLTIVFFSVTGSILAIVKWDRNEGKYFWGSDVKAEGGQTHPAGRQNIE